MSTTRTGFKLPNCIINHYRLRQHINDGIIRRQTMGKFLLEVAGCCKDQNLLSDCFLIDQHGYDESLLELTFVQAQKYLLDPLNAPEPSDETGPGSHFVHPVEKLSTPKEPTATTSKVPSISVYPSPPASASPTQSSFHHSNPFSPSHKQAAFGDYPQAGSSRRSLDEPVDNRNGLRRGR